MTTGKRNPGLDIARSIAILLVLICHLNSFFILSNPNLSHYLNSVLELFIVVINPVIGWLGVELFFVLSGFLIGQILIKTFVVNNKEDSNKNLLMEFYFRRWFRTLPLYYLLLIINIIFFAKNKDPEFIAHYFIFFQNFLGMKLRTFMEVSWSLVIEEWFYLIFPLIILALKKFHRSFTHQAFSNFLLIFILSVLLFRIIYVNIFDPYFVEIKAFVFLRLDSLAFGILLAYLYLYKKNIYNLFAKKFFLILSLLILFGVSFLYFYIYKENQFLDFTRDGPWNFIYFSRTSMFTIVSLAFFFLIAHLESLKIKNIPLFTYISKVSYSLYLINWPVIMTLKPLILKYGFINLETTILSYALVLAIIFLISTIAYKFYEKPMMDLRDSDFIRNLLENKSKSEQKEKLNEPA